MRGWRGIRLLMAVLLILSRPVPVLAAEDAEIMKIVVPTEFPFMLFQMPNGERNIVSGDFDIMNYGNTDIEFEIQEIRCLFENEEEYVQVATPSALNMDSLNKEVFMYFEKADITMEETGNGFVRTFHRDGQVDTSTSRASEEDLLNARLKETAAEIAVLDDDDVVITTGGAVSCKIVLKAAHYEDGKFVRLDPESIFSFRLAGFVNSNPAVKWGSNEIKLQFNYSWSKLEAEEDLRSGESEEALPDGQNKEESEEALPDGQRKEEPVTVEAAEKEEDTKKRFLELEEVLRNKNPAENGDRRR